MELKLGQIKKHPPMITFQYQTIMNTGDCPPNDKNQSHGSVLIAISKNSISDEISELLTAEVNI